MGYSRVVWGRVGCSGVQVGRVFQNGVEREVVRSLGWSRVERGRMGYSGLEGDIV